MRMVCCIPIFKRKADLAKGQKLQSSWENNVESVEDIEFSATCQFPSFRFYLRNRVFYIISNFDRPTPEERSSLSVNVIVDGIDDPSSNEASHFALITSIKA